MKSIHDITVKSNAGKPVNLSDYKGKVLLIVNTASKCGYTSQYEQLEAIHKKYAPKGFLVLGFPSNDFGAQEPGSNEEIAKFCKLNYGVSFPLFEKNPVKGATKQELFKILTEESGKSMTGEVNWNFEKFLVGKDGKLVGRFPSKVKPDSAELTSKIEGLL
jgi:glutathione peroxidase